MSKDALQIRVHDRGDRRLDGILRLIEEAGRARPVAEVLASLCQAVAEIARVEVASVYVQEIDPAGHEVLVMRGNVGLAPGAVGHVTLRPGEGLTGFVAECLRPVSLAVARHDERYKHVPGIGEERYPSYLGIPLLVGGAVGGVLVLQRRTAKEFAPAEVALAAALAAPVAFALERARARAVEREGERVPGATSTRSARLDGRGGGGGVALGRCDVLPALDGVVDGGIVTTHAGARPGHAVALALAALARELGRAETYIGARGDGVTPDLRAQLRALALLLDDLRLRDLVIAECSENGVGKGLAIVAREYARAPYRVPGSPETGRWLAERAAEVEDLCLLVGARTVGRLLPANGAVVVAERLTGIVALAAIARRAVGIVLSGSAEDSSLGIAVARAAGLPVVTDVAGLFAWARADDRVLLDGEAGAVRINPPATVVARFRAQKA